MTAIMNQVRVITNQVADAVSFVFLFTLAAGVVVLYAAIATTQSYTHLDYQHLAKVYDGGTTDTGRPYFVMELVRGVRINDYCDEVNLATPDRLHLFIRVCQAVQHAHRDGATAVFLDQVADADDCPRVAGGRRGAHDAAFSSTVAPSRRRFGASTTIDSPPVSPSVTGTWPSRAGPAVTARRSTLPSRTTHANAASPSPKIAPGGHSNAVLPAACPVAPGKPPF